MKGPVAAEKWARGPGRVLASYQLQLGQAGHLVFPNKVRGNAPFSSSKIVKTQHFCPEVAVIATPIDNFSCSWRLQWLPLRLLLGQRLNLRVLLLDSKPKGDPHAETVIGG
jgi:hypothetical protein